MIGKEIDEKFSYKMGLAIGQYLDGKGKAIVACDPRPGAKEITQALIKGLIDSGVTVSDCGILPTPELTWFQVKRGDDLGVSVTGSHLAWNMIGIIPTLADGVGISGKDGEKITELFNSLKVSQKVPNSLKVRNLFSDHEEYIQALLAAADAAAIRRKNYRILFDPVNGSAIDVGKKLFSQLGEVIMINDRFGQRPTRAAEPRAETLKETAKQVVKNHGDLGIAMDVDADRVLFIDETGEVLSEDLTGVILGEAEIKNKTDVLVTPINSSGIFKAVIEKAGGKVVECRVGPPAISAEILKTKAIFGYEESGKYFFPREFIWADGLLASVKMLQVMAKFNKSLSQIRQSYPVYFQVKLAFACPFEKMPGRWVGKGEKLIFGDSWLFIRASGTEPLIRVFSDSPLQSRAEELAEKGKKIVEKICAE